MAFGKIRITQRSPGKPVVITLDGHKLDHVRAYTVNNAVDGIPTVTLEFVATAEITEIVYDTDPSDDLPRS